MEIMSWTDSVLEGDFELSRILFGGLCPSTRKVMHL